jgi:hypothetical protein
MNKIEKSTRAGKKYMVKYKGKIIHFGQIGASQFFDSTPLKLYSHLDHNDKKRRDRYRARHEKILLKDGTPAYKNKSSPSWWSWTYLWT